MMLAPGIPTCKRRQDRHHQNNRQDEGPRTSVSAFTHLLSSDGSELLLRCLTSTEAAYAGLLGTGEHTVSHRQKNKCYGGAGDPDSVKQLVYSATCSFNGCAERSHKDKSPKDSCWNVKQKVVQLSTRAQLRRLPLHIAPGLCGSELLLLFLLFLLLLLLFLLLLFLLLLLLLLMLLNVHRDHKDVRVEEPRTANSIFTQLLS